MFFLFENDHITHRVLHVQLVSKIARTIGRFLRLNEDLLEAIALGHDIGHTPFGHDGEEYLNKICLEKGIGCFKHNAQSVRFLKDLEEGGNGVNLTLQVLDGILCHNGEEISDHYEPSPKKTIDKFLEEYDYCFTEDTYGKQLKPFTLEGCVVRVSDVIAYIGRDIEDAITVGLLTRDELPKNITEVLGDNNRDIINILVRDLVECSLGRSYLCFSPCVLKALKALRDYNYAKIYYSPNKQKQDKKIEAMFRLLYDSLFDDLISENHESSIYSQWIDTLNEDYREKTVNERIVIDYISGMTDDFFYNTFKDQFLPRRHNLHMDEK